MPGAFAWMTVPPPAFFAARCGHNLLGIALVCDDDQKLVFGIFQDAFLSFLKRLTVR